MKNTLKIALILIGIALIGYGAYFLIFGPPPADLDQDKLKHGHDTTQSLAMMAFGALCLLSGMAYGKR